MKFEFPKDFLFGCASSACQIESGCYEGGKGEDVHQHYAPLMPEKYGDNTDPDRSADFYHKYPEDIKLMQELGLNAFRFSISWSRIYPNGPEEVCQAGIDYYSDMIDKLKAAGIVTFFDLWHCDLPYWVIEKGGLVVPEFIDWFTTYAKTCFEAFGDRVDYWSTVNEPDINVKLAYLTAHTAPFIKDPDLAYKVCHNMILAHYKTVKLYKSLGLKGKIGAVTYVVPFFPASSDPKDIAAAERYQAEHSGLWLDPMLKGHYPELLMNWPYFVEKLPTGANEELRENFIASDFIGVNYYNSGIARYVDDGRFCTQYADDELLKKDAYGFTISPAGIFDALMYLHKTYPGKEIFITENGVSRQKTGDYEAELEDDYRIIYMREHLRGISRAISAGIPVKGYFHWSFLDTNEIYAGGYKYIFGLVQVRYDTLERFPRKSFSYYQKLISDGFVC